MAWGRLEKPNNIGGITLLYNPVLSDKTGNCPTVGQELYCISIHYTFLRKPQNTGRQRKDDHALPLVARKGHDFVVQLLPAPPSASPHRSRLNDNDMTSS